MASEFAWRIAEQSLNGSGLCPEHIKVLKKAAMHIADAELQEVREVLDALRPSPPRNSCWCSRGDMNALDGHKSFCQRARTLLERLRIKGQE